MKILNNLFPDILDVVIVDDKRLRTSYLFSVWLGLTSCVTNLFGLLWRLIVKEFLLGSLKLVLLIGMSLYMGFAGRLRLAPDDDDDEPIEVEQPGV